MASHRQSRIVGLWIACAVSFSCSSNVEHKTWERLDYEAALTAMRYPTGQLAALEPPNSPISAQIEKQAPEVMSRLLLFVGTLALLAQAASTEPPDTGDDAGDGLPDAGIIPTPDSEPDIETSRTGTHLFLEAACPGPDAYRLAQDFKYGFIRIDSDDLTDFSMKGMEKGAHLLLQFEDCQIPSATKSGSSKSCSAIKRGHNVELDQALAS